MNARGSTIGTILAVLTSLLLLCRDVHAGSRRRVLAASPTLAAPVLTVVELGQVIDAGTIVWRGGAQRSAAVTRTVTMRIGEPSRDSRGVATVRAFVETFDPRCTIRIDGIALTTAPRAIRRNVPIGIAFSHRIEIEVPVSAADGPLQTSIAWE